MTVNNEARANSNEHRTINTSEARSQLGEVVDDAMSGDRIIFTRYGKNRAAIVPTDDLLVIDHLLEHGEYERFLDAAKEIMSKRQNPS